MNTNIPPRWYMLNKIGMATLCSNEDDAICTQKEADMLFPAMAPHHAALLAPVDSTSKPDATDFTHFVRLVQQWAQERGIYEHSTPQAQVLKAVSEMGELADATIKGDRDDFIDSVGDVIVCLINACFVRGVEISECTEAAWDAIKGRKGYMTAGGAFVKE
ncbi:MazG-like family protein [Orrella sp. 11846]|uniref:MazG-like family protein n=1 Tax=Orrella sp. 11846 TaxID=3409913 RepID=UPI003B5AFB81